MSLVKILRLIAKNEAEEGEFHPEEHTCWLAANRIEELQAMIDGKGDPQLLHEIATRLWHKEQHEKIMAEYHSKHKKSLVPNTVQRNGTG